MMTGADASETFTCQTLAGVLKLTPRSGPTLAEPQL
jgi:hypothetical protein